MEKWNLETQKESKNSIFTFFILFDSLSFLFLLILFIFMFLCFSLFYIYVIMRL